MSPKLRNESFSKTKSAHLMTTLGGVEVMELITKKTEIPFLITTFDQLLESLRAVLD